VDFRRYSKQIMDYSIKVIIREDEYVLRVNTDVLDSVIKYAMANKECCNLEIRNGLPIIELIIK
jgi:hypothetical protein